MTTIPARLIGDQTLLPRDELERLVAIARLSEAIELALQPDDLPTLGLMRLAETGGAFDFWSDPGEDLDTEDRSRE